MNAYADFPCTNSEIPICWNPELEVRKAVENLQLLYAGNDYQFALMLLPIGILMALILTFFLKETYSVSKE